MFKNKEVTVVDRIRSLQRSDKANKQCANCGELGPVYICSDFYTFVCTECSGLHRELSHKVKSISMSNWTKDEADALENAGGNARDYAKYMANYDPRAFPQPQSSNRDRLRDFIRAKYVERRWALDGHPGSSKEHQKVTDKKENHSHKVHPQKEQVDLLNFAAFPEPIPVKADVTPEQVKPQPVQHTPEEAIQAHFSRGLESLEKLFKSNPVRARELATSVMESLNRQFSNSRNPSPLETPVVSSSTVSTIPTSASMHMPNPFDLLPAPQPTSASVPMNHHLPMLSPGFSPVRVEQTTQLASTVHPSVMPVAQHKNPFDDLLQL